MSQGREHRYESDDLTVRYDAKRCIHAAECVRGLPAVFDPKRRPWVEPGAASPSQVIDVVSRCPTGALSVDRADGSPVDMTEPMNVVSLVTNGPLYVRGDIEVASMDQDTEDALETGARCALCRCGHSENKPFCDNSHGKVGFTADAGQTMEGIETDLDVNSNAETGTDVDHDGTLQVTPAPNGPLLIAGRFEVRDGSGRPVHRAEKAALCRCGHSANKPFCDGSHVQAGFEG